MIIHDAVNSDFIVPGKVVALDTETVGAEPGVESPVHKAKVITVQVAWRDDGGELRSELYSEEILEDFLFQMWCMTPAYPKVGANIEHWDYHALLNHGIELNGIVGDVSVLSRCMNPDELAGLKPLGKRYGLSDRGDYDQTFKVQPGTLGPTEIKSYKTWNGKKLVLRKLDEPVPATRLSWAKTSHRELTIEQVMSNDWAMYMTEERRNKALEYSILDAEETLLIWEKMQIGAKQW